MTPLFETIGFVPKLVLFDLDGTLLDTLPDLYSASLSMANTLNITAPSLPQVEQWFAYNLHIGLHTDAHVEQ